MRDYSKNIDKKQNNNYSKKQDSNNKRQDNNSKKQGNSDRNKSGYTGVKNSDAKKKDNHAQNKKKDSFDKAKKKDSFDKSKQNNYAGKLAAENKNTGVNKTDAAKRTEDSRSSQAKKLCPASARCGGCQLLGYSYKEQLAMKQKEMEMLLSKHVKVEKIIGMEDPMHYRNKVHAVLDVNKGKIISGVYEAGTHRVVPVKTCLIENETADKIIQTIVSLMPSFKIKAYSEDNGYGYLRHILIRTGHATGQVMVVLVAADTIFPSKNNFVKALLKEHPEITTIVLNVNNRDTSMVLGDKEVVMYGKGYIEDELCGKRFVISPKSFYQVNPVQTEVLYNTAISMAGLTGTERVIDAYCGIGTIGISAADKAGEVIGVELNPDAVRDAIKNAKLNNIKNISFYKNDAGDFMQGMAAEGEKADVVIMDPPRSGSTESFIDAVAVLAPKKVVYVSCGPDTLARDLEYFKKKGYKAEKAVPVDMFPATVHCEVVTSLVRK